MENIIICPNRVKTKYLNYRKENPFYNATFFSKEDLINNIIFSYDDRALLYLSRKGYLLENTTEMIKSMYFIKKGVSSKIDKLIELKEELFKEKLLTKNDFLISYLKNKKVIIEGYDESDLELNFISKELNLDCHYVDENIQKKEFVINTFDIVVDEIRYIFETIHSLYLNGVDLKKIKVVCNDSIYLDYLKKYQMMYNIKFNFQSEEKYVNSIEFKDLIDRLKTSLFIKAFEDSYLLSNDNSYLSKIYAKYLEVKDYIKDEELITYLSYISNNLTIQNEQYENGIDIISYPMMNKDDYNILVGFRINYYPRIYKDDEYLSNNEKEKLGILTSFAKQEIEEREIIKVISQMNHLYLSFSRFYDKKELYPSLIIEKINGFLNPYSFKNIVYSKKHFDFMMGKIIDEYELFSLKSQYYEASYKNILNYNSYSKKFKPLTSYENKNLILSYSQLDDFYSCAFSYYLKYVLKIDENEDTIYNRIGNLTHLLLEKLIKGEVVNFDDELNKMDIPLNQICIIKSLKEPILKAIDNINSFKNESRFDFKSEIEDLYYQIDDNAILKGRIDLLIEDDTSFALVDYKTGQESFDNKIIKYGRSLQLPIYYLLSKSSSALNNKNVFGLYINHVLDKKYYEGDYSYLKFDGISIDKDKYISSIEEKYISTPNKNLQTQDDFVLLIDEVKNKINEAVIKIRDGSFDINPKNVSNKEVCKYCTFKDICFIKKDEVLKINAKDGDENGCN